MTFAIYHDASLAISRYSALLSSDSYLDDHLFSSTTMCQLAEAPI